MNRESIRLMSAPSVDDLHNPTSTPHCSVTYSNAISLRGAGDGGRARVSVYPEAPNAFLVVAIHPRRGGTCSESRWLKAETSYMPLRRHCRIDPDTSYLNIQATRLVKRTLIIYSEGISYQTVLHWHWNLCSNSGQYC